MSEDSQEQPQQVKAICWRRGSQFFRVAVYTLQPADSCTQKYCGKEYPHWHFDMNAMKKGRGFRSWSEATPKYIQEAKKIAAENNYWILDTCYQGMPLTATVDNLFGRAV